MGLQTAYFDRNKYEPEALAKHFEKNDMLRKEEFETMRSPSNFCDVFMRIHFGPEADSDG